MNTLKLRLIRSVMALAELTIGILLLIDPAAFTSGILTASGIVLILCGIVIIAAPFASADALWKFAAFGLIVSAGLDILAAVLGSGRKKEED